MAKDPAFLFYYQDFLVGTDYFTNEATGAYIRCLCHQAHKGEISKSHMSMICKTQVVHNIVVEKFVSEKKGIYFNPKLREVMDKRRKYAESRRKNRSGGQ